MTLFQMKNIMRILADTYKISFAEFFFVATWVAHNCNIIDTKGIVREFCVFKFALKPSIDMYLIPMCQSASWNLS